MGMFPGSAGVLPGHQAQIVPNQQSQGIDAQGFVQLALAVKQAKQQEHVQKQQEAKTKLDAIYQYAQQQGGKIPPEMAKAAEDAMKILGVDFGKSAKGIGMPDPTKPAEGGQPQGQPQAENVMAVGKAMNPQSGAQAANPATTANAAKAPGGGVSSDQSGMMGVLQGIRNSANFQGQNANAKQMLETQMTQMQQKLMDPNVPESERNKISGSLYRMAEAMHVGQFNIEGHTFFFGGEKRQQAMMDKASGFQTQDDIVKRTDSIAGKIIESKRVSSPAEAYQYARDIVENRESSIKLKPDWTSYSAMLDFHEKLVESGVDPNLASKIAKGVEAGADIKDLMPGKLQPVILQQLAMQRQGLDIALEGKKIEEKRLGIEEARYQREEERQVSTDRANLYKLKIELAKEGREALRDKYQMKYNAYRSKSPLPKDISDGIDAELANATGMQAHEVKSTWDRLWGLKGETKFESAPPKGETQSSIEGFIGTPIPGAGDMSSHKGATTSQPKEAYSSSQDSVASSAGKAAAKAHSYLKNVTADQMKQMAKAMYHAPANVAKEASSGFLDFLREFSKGYKEASSGK